MFIWRQTTSILATNTASNFSGLHSRIRPAKFPTTVPEVRINDLPLQLLLYFLKDFQSPFLCQNQWNRIEMLRRNPPEVRVTRDKNFVSRLFASHHKLLCDYFKYILKEIISNNTKCRKQILKFI